MKSIKSKNIKFGFILGFGYWKDLYSFGATIGHAHNYILPFVRIQIAVLYYGEQKKDITDYCSLGRNPNKCEFFSVGKKGCESCGNYLNK